MAFSALLTACFGPTGDGHNSRIMPLILTLVEFMLTYYSSGKKITVASIITVVASLIRAYKCYKRTASDSFVKHYIRAVNPMDGAGTRKLVGWKAVPSFVISMAFAAYIAKSQHGSLNKPSSSVGIEDPKLLLALLPMLNLASVHSSSPILSAGLSAVTGAITIPIMYVPSLYKNDNLAK